MPMFLKKILGWAVIAAVLCCSFYVFAEKEEQSATEYELKGHILVRFHPFITWPEKVFSDPKTPVVIGIIGKDYFGDKFTKMIEKKNAGKQRKFVIQRFKQNAPVSDLQKCHFLFISSSIARGRMKKIIDDLKNHPVITVGDVYGFCSLGGIIKLVITKEKKVRWEINKGAADRLGIQFHSQLLKWAIKLIGEKNGK